MKGKVNSAHEAVVRIQISGKGRSRKVIRAVIDTGYTGFLSLPPAAIRSLGMRLVGRRNAQLADRSLVTFRYYAGIVVWNNIQRVVEVDESPSDPLIGMKLLEGSELKIRVQRGGQVAIRSLI